jgi:ABC-type glycerol-3-phosphate transport system permease component
MARKTTAAQMTLSTIFAWAVGFIMFFPILWTALAAFKSETDAYSLPENWWSTPWTTENFFIVQERSNYLRYVLNTTIIAVFSTLLGLLFAIPAAWSMAFQPEERSSVSWPGYIWIVLILGAFAAAGAIAYSVGWGMADRPALGLALIVLFSAPIVAWVWTRRTGDKLLWMLSTKMMPPAGALIPIYLIFNRNGLVFKDWGWIDLRDYNLIDTFAGMIPLMMLLNLPIVVWMLYTYFKEIPFGILEAGAGLCAGADGGAGHRLDAAAQRDPLVERSVLDVEPHQQICGAVELLHLRIFISRRPVLGQAFSGLADGDCPHYGAGLVLPAPVGARSHLRRGQIGISSWARLSFNRSPRNSAPSASSRASTLK